MPFPDKKYSIIYADPPWKYNDSCHSGRRGACYKYPTMSLIDIQSLPLKAIAADNSVLFLWVTFPMLAECLALMPLWGFTYKTVGFVWVKGNLITEKFPIGMGNWTRSNPEVCLLGIRGKPKRFSAGVRSEIISPRETHSKKPAEVRQRIVDLMGPSCLPRIELFARERPAGWDVWGNEVPNG